MHKPRPVQENETHKILWDFEILTDYLILARRLDLLLKSSGFCHSSWPLGENKRKQKDRQILGPCQRTKKSGGTWGL